MKEFSHPGGKEKEVIDLNKAINNTITVARNEWKYVANVVTNLSEKLPFIAVFPGEFNQVILNMIVNAAHAIADKYGNDGDKGTITITTRKSAESVLIAIADDGKGIPEENLEKIFDPFFTTKEVGKGTGQGLSMAFKTIVEGHQGTIAVESEVGVGTTFTIKLPVEVL
jgi:two-component system, NtrC family, sensor kinase